MITKTLIRNLPSLSSEPSETGKINNQPKLRFKDLETVFLTLANSIFNPILARISKQIHRQRLFEKIFIFLILASFLTLLLPYHSAFASEIFSEKNRQNLGPFRQTVIYNPFKIETKLEVVYTRYISTSAYTSRVEETDASPFTTASGAIVYDGIVAANFLRFGTKVRFPEYFGDKVFEVQDRMNPRYYYNVDIWMKDHAEAKIFGRRVLKIEVLKEVPVIKLDEVVFNK